MFRKLRICWQQIITLLLFSMINHAYANVSYETLTFIDSDGHSYLNYATTRSDVPNYTVFLDKAENLGDYLYINPNHYEFDDSSDDVNLLKFAQGSYAIISQGDFINVAAPDKSAVTLDSDGIYTLHSWDGEKQANGHYGVWNTPDPFARFASAWVFPEKFEVLSYASNRPGEWVERDNTLAFFAHDVNNLVFDITYRRRSQPAFSNLRDQLQKNDSIAVEQNQDSIKVILKNEILFDSGSATLSGPGRSVIKDVVGGLTAEGGYTVIVEGHTDDVPIRGALKNIFPTNWELSAKRALNVVHALSDEGVDPALLQARAFGSHKPRMPNDNPVSRSVNRRIELIIEPI